MKHPLAAASALAITLSALAGPALADDAVARDDARFPMKATDFQRRLDARLAETRAHMEARLLKKDLPAERAKDLRARFEAVAAKVAAEAKRVSADGVVTKEEAREVRAAAHVLRAEMRHALRGKHVHGHGHHRGDGGGHASAH